MNTHARDSKGARPRRLYRLVWPLVGDALGEFWSSWRDHVLTLFGIAWGSVAVLTMLAVGSGFRTFLELGIEKTGDRWTIVDGRFTTAESDGRRPGRPVHLDIHDIERLREGVPSARHVAGEIDGFELLETPALTRQAAVNAGAPAMFDIANHKIARGRWYREVEEREARRVAVLGPQVAADFFPNLDPVGRRFQINGEPFEVIGVLERKGFQLVVFADLHDNSVFIPLKTGQRSFGHEDRVSHVFVNAWRREDTEDLRREARAVLWPSKHLSANDTEAIRFFSLPDILRPIERVLAALHFALGAIGTVALAMAGVGVANRMIALANARRSEFAVRRACGARRTDVELAVLVETLLVVLSGGFVGAALAWVTVMLLSAAPLPPEVPDPIPSVGALVTTFAVLVGTGIFAGLAPARTAGRFEPSIVLRDA